MKMKKEISEQEAERLAQEKREADLLAKKKQDDERLAEEANRNRADHAAELKSQLGTSSSESDDE